GVDLFFVLSGYLITTILLDARGSPAYYRAFYTRRALRILPAYVVFLAGIWILGQAAGMTSAERVTFVNAQPWYGTFVANVLIALRGWDAAPFGTSGLWSLAVE